MFRQDRLLSQCMCLDQINCCPLRAHIKTGHILCVHHLGNVAVLMHTFRLDRLCLMHVQTGQVIVSMHTLRPDRVLSQCTHLDQTGFCCSAHVITGHVAVLCAHIQTGWVAILVHMLIQTGHITILCGHVYRTRCCPFTEHVPVSMLKFRQDMTCCMLSKCLDRRGCCLNTHVQTRQVTVPCAHI